jgi:hypothetical protein
MRLPWVAHLEVGKPLPISVYVPGDQTAGASGTVFYRLPDAATTYAEQALTRRGTGLYALLPTQDLAVGQVVFCYLDVAAAGEAVTFGSPTRPYRTEIVSREELILRSLRVSVQHGRDDAAVKFTLQSGDVEVTRAQVRYTPPDVDGYVVQEMAREGSRWELTLKPTRVSAGKWQYRVMVTVGGQVYHWPRDERDAIFRVKAAK